MRGFYQSNNLNYYSQYISAGGRPGFNSPQTSGFEWANNGTVQMTFNGTGSLGVGTANPATLLDVAGNAQFGSGATKSTFTATGSLTMDPAASISTKYLIAAPGTSTMTPTGVLFFIDSTTVSGSTCTVSGNTLVEMSSYTLAANSLSIGHTLVLDCWYINNSVPGSPNLKPRMDAGGANNGDYIYWAAVNVSNAATHTRVELAQLTANTGVYSGRAEHCAYNGTCTYPVPIDNATNTGDPVITYKTNVAHTLQCGASNNTGGNINFIAMKVSIQ
jgi:hypothetical protein